jgi:preprotein translocase subunit SecD
MNTPLRLLLTLCVLLAIAPAARASGGQPGAYIGLHVQGEEHESTKFVVPSTVDGQQYFFRISPDVSARHFNAFRAFPAPDGSYGVILHLSEPGQRAMDIMTRTNRGRLMRTIVNGKVVGTLRIDSDVTDGRFVIWSGLDAPDLKLMAKKLKRLDVPAPGERGGEPEQKKRWKWKKRSNAGES